MRGDSPEDRLLNLIKGIKPKPENGADKAPPPDKETLLTGLSKKVLLKSGLFKDPVLKWANRILPAILLVSAGYLVYSLIFTAQKDITRVADEKEELSAGTGTAAKPNEDLSLPQAAEYSAYSKDIEGKKLFNASSIGGPSQGDAGTDISKKFNLVGIIAGAEPQAIIEDAETKKTYYLYKDQSFNDVTLLEISEGKVVISYKGREIILVL